MQKRAAWLVLALLGAWSCGEEIIHKVAPAIAVETLEGEKAVALQFAISPVGDEVGEQLRIRSMSATRLHVERIEVEGVGAAHFSVEEESFEVQGKSERDLSITFRPAAVGDHQATLRIHSNDPQRPVIEVAVSGTGIDSAIRVEGCMASTETDKDRCSRTMVEAPEVLDLGQVVEGTPETLRVTVTNLGRKPLELHSVAFEDPDLAASYGFTLPKALGPQTIGGLSSGGLAVGFHPPQGLIQVVEVALILKSSDSSREEIRFPIRADVVPNEPPVACLRFVEIQPHGGKVVPITPGEEVVISPGDRLLFDARVREGCSGDPEDGENVTLEWSIEGDDGFSHELRFEGDRFEAVYQADVIGSFVVRLKVKDSLAQEATADGAGIPAELHFLVEPREDIGVEIRWPGGQGVDLDVHLVRDGPGGLFGVNDFYWDNQQVTWGAEPPLSNPRLAVDDKGARMVETVLLNLPEPGKRYSVYVHLQRDARSGRTGARACSATQTCTAPAVCSMTNDAQGVCLAPVEAEVRLFILRQEWEFSLHNPSFSPSASLGSPCETWWVGDVVWGDPPTFVPGPPNILWEGKGVQNATCYVDD